MNLPHIFDGAAIRAMRLARAAGASRRALSISPAYPAAVHTGTRTNTTFFPLDSRFELRNQDWKEILKKSRYLRNATGVVRALFEKPVKFVCPGGLTPNAATPDENYNEAADEYFERWANAPIDVSHEWDFYSGTEMIATEMPCDGSLFALKVKGLSAHCQMQFFKAHQIGDPLATAPTSLPFQHGILKNAVGREIAYRVLQDGISGTLSSFRDYSAEDMLHIRDSSRISFGRPLPWIYHGANPALDVLDMRALDQVARKLNLALAAVIKRLGNKGAGLGPKLDAEQIAAMVNGGLDAPPATPTPAPSAGITWEQILGGGAIPVLGEGEELQNLDTDRSPVNWIAAAEFLIREIAAGYGVSYEFLWNMAALGGPTARFILEDLNAFCEKFRRILVGRWCQPTRSWVIANAIVNGELDEPRSGNWWECVWSGPAKVTVDRGREGALYVRLLEKGMITLEEWWSLFGKDSRRMRRKRIKEIREDLVECEKNGVPYSLYCATAAGQSGDPQVIPVTAAAASSVTFAHDLSAALQSGDDSFLAALQSALETWHARPA